MLKINGEDIIAKVAKLKNEPELRKLLIYLANSSNVPTSARTIANALLKDNKFKGANDSKIAQILMNIRDALNTSKHSKAIEKIQTYLDS